MTTMIRVGHWRKKVDQWMTAPHWWMITGRIVEFEYLPIGPLGERNMAYEFNDDWWGKLDEAPKVQIRSSLDIIP
jgi:hypothetical protein